MLHKLIVAALVIGASIAHGQGTSGWSIVTTEGTNLYQDGVVIAEDFVGYSFRPSYGSFIASGSPFLVAESVAVTNGTISSGSVTNTWVEDASYLVVNESGVFEVYFTFDSTGTDCPRILNFHGRYEGNAPHNIKFSAYDFTNSVYTNFTADADDLTSGTVDQSLQFTYPDPQENFCDSNGISRVRILHDGSAVGTHNLYVDFIQETYATAIAETGGIWYDFATGTIEQQNNMTMVAASNQMVTTSAGDYEWKWYISFTGETDTEFQVRNLTNGVPTSAVSIRTIGSSPAIGSMSAFGGGRLPSGATNSFQFKASTDGAWISFVSASTKLKKDAN